MPIASLRFVESSPASGGTYKQYRISADGAELFCCDLSKKTVWAPVAFRDASNLLHLQLSPQGKFLNKIWQLSDGAERPCGVLELEGSDGWIARDTHGEEVLRLADPRTWSAKLVETALNSWPDRYVLCVGTQEVGQVARRLRNGELEPSTRFQKLKGLLKPRDCAAEFYPPLEQDKVHLAAAAILLLVEVTVQSARS